MGNVFISREEKAEWGFACNQRADGTLWAGKGYRRTLEGQLGADVVGAAAIVLTHERGPRMGRFWIDLENRIVTIMIGESHENKYTQVPF